jgi:hypothetical protein
MFTAEIVPRLVLTHDAGRIAYLLLSTYTVMTGRLSIWIVVSALAHVVVWLLMRGVDRPFLVLRLVLALAELLVVVRLAERPDMIYIPAGISVLIDLSLRFGVMSIAAVAGLVLAPVLAGTSAGRTVIAANFAPLPLAAAIGWGVRVAARNRDRALDALAETETEASVTAARLAGRNDVLTRSGEVADLVQRAGTLLDLGATSMVRRSVGDAKASVAEDTRRTATYLGDVLIRWQQHRHASSAALDRAVAFEIGPTERVMLLTRGQADAVRRTLDADPPRGSIRVTVTGGDIQRPDLPRSLHLGQAELDIPVDRAHRPVLRTPAAAIVALIGLWMLLPFAAGMAEFSWLGLAMGALTIGFARGIGLASRRDDRALSVSLFGLVAWLALFTVVVQPVTTDRGLQFPFTGAMEYLVGLSLIALPLLRGAARWLAWLTVPLAGLLAVRHGLGVALSRDLIAETTPIVMMFAAMLGVGSRFVAHSEQQEQRLLELRSERSAAAFASGRAEELDRLDAALVELQDDLVEIRPRIRPDIADVVARRIVLAERALATAR